MNAQKNRNKKTLALTILQMDHQKKKNPISSFLTEFCPFIFPSRKNIVQMITFKK